MKASRDFIERKKQILKDVKRKDTKRKDIKSKPLPTLPSQPSPGLPGPPQRTPKPPLGPQIGKVCILSLHRGGLLTVTNDRGDIETLKWENSNMQKWKIESVREGRYRFRNLSHGGTLGVDNSRTVRACHYFADRDCETFRVEPSGETAQDRRQCFSLRFDGRNSFLAQPSMTNAITVTYQEGFHLPIQISYVDSNSWLESVRV